jgi:hypothetical protein
MSVKLDPVMMQWIASVLLVLSGVQNLVIVGRIGTALKLRTVGGLIALASIGFGVLMIIGLLGVKI